MSDDGDIYRRGILESMVLQRLLQDLSNRLPLRTVLIVPFALQIFAAVGLTGYLAFRNGQRAVDELAQQLQGEISHRIEERLDSYLSQAHLINQMNIQAVQLNSLDLDNLEQLDRHFAQQIRLFEAISYIYFANPQGEFSGAEQVPGERPRIGRAGRGLPMMIPFIPMPPMTPDRPRSNCQQFPVMMP